MLNRRQLLIAGLALPLVSPRATGARASDNVVPGIVLVDRRHARSRAFGAALVARGASRVDCEGDVSPVWRAALGPIAAAGAGTIAGLTTPATLHCLERLALAHGLCVIARHVAAADPAWRYDAAEVDAAPLLRWVIAGRSQIAAVAGLTS